MDFGFRHFTITQNNTALKVGTDAMVLGALCEFQRRGHLLDIGTGTGVLALICAQRFDPLTIDALEPDNGSAMDARLNFLRSPFDCKPQLFQTTIQAFHPDTRYDGIIANPPYFIGSTKNDSSTASNARHQTGLTTTELFEGVSRLLAHSGTFWMIYPHAQHDHTEKEAQKTGLFPARVIEIFGKPGKPVRIVSAFQFDPKELTSSTFTIRDSDGQYTEEYIAATRELHGLDLSRRL